MLHVLLGKEGMFYLRYLIDFLFTEFWKFTKFCTNVIAKLETEFFIFGTQSDHMIFILMKQNKHNSVT